MTAVASLLVRKVDFFYKYIEEPSSTNLCQSNEIKCRHHNEGSVRREMFYEEIDIKKSKEIMHI